MLAVKTQALTRTLARAIVYGLTVWLCSTTVIAPHAAPLAFSQKSVAFGSFVEMTIADDNVSKEKANQLIEQILHRFHTMEKRFYAWDKNSELAYLNQSIAKQTFPIPISQAMTKLLNSATNYSVQTDHLFNPAIGQLIDLWGFYSTPAPNQPPFQHAIDKWLQHQVNMEQIIVKNNYVIRANAAIRIDFGAIIKGVAVDTARDILKQAGITNALINVGGSLLAMGENKNRPWMVALHQNREQAPIGVIALHDGEAISTSGDSEIYFIHNGNRYHHILNPLTGYPATTVQTAIVISHHPTAAGAISDAVATALVISDKMTTQKILTKFNPLLVWQIGDKNYISPALQVRLKKTSTN